MAVWMVVMTTVAMAPKATGVDGGDDNSGDGS